MELQDVAIVARCTDICSRAFGFKGHHSFTLTFHQDRKRTSVPKNHTAMTLIVTVGAPGGQTRLPPLMYHSMSASCSMRTREFVMRRRTSIRCINRMAFKCRYIVDHASCQLTEGGSEISHTDRPGICASTCGAAQSASPIVFA